LASLDRYIVTVETSQHRFFTFLPSEVIPDNRLVCFAEADAWIIAALSSKTHVTWALKTGGLLEDRPIYTKTRGFDPFPFPDPDENLKAQLRALGEELDATRKRVQAEHPDLTLTGLYNVLEKIRAGAALTPADEDVKQRGRVLILKELHDQIDAATAQAYGWPVDLTDEEILERLVALNAERAREEAAGHVRWLRPDYQIPRFAKEAKATTGDLDLGETVVALDKGLPDFPKDPYEAPLAIERLLIAAGRPMDAAELARGFKRGGKRIEQRITQALTTLARYGNIIALDGGRYASRRAA
ncbi:type IIL restriction-modification enzyme MmeI, partial [Phenylobacterium sp.]